MLRVEGDPLARPAVGDRRRQGDRTQDLAAHLVASGVPIAVADHLRLNHGFGQTTTDLFGSLSAVPMIPIVVNCVGAPLATIERTAALGEAVGSFLRETPDDERVLVIASGGISHAPPSLIPGANKLSESGREAVVANNKAHAVEAINPAWDQGFLGRTATRDWSSPATGSQADLDPLGRAGRRSAPGWPPCSPGISR